MQNQPNAPATPNAVQRRGARAAVRTLRIARNVLALLGVFFLYLLWHGYSAYEADMAKPDSQSCALTRCM